MSSESQVHNIDDEEDDDDDELHIPLDSYAPLISDINNFCNKVKDNSASYASENKSSKNNETELKDEYQYDVACMAIEKINNVLKNGTDENSSISRIKQTLIDAAKNAYGGTSIAKIDKIAEDIITNHKVTLYKNLKNWFNNTIVKNKNPNAKSRPLSLSEYVNKPNGLLKAAISAGLVDEVESSNDFQYLKNIRFQSYGPCEFLTTILFGTPDKSSGGDFKINERPVEVKFISKLGEGAGIGRGYEQKTESYGSLKESCDKFKEAVKSLNTKIYALQFQNKTPKRVPNYFNKLITQQPSLLNAGKQLKQGDFRDFNDVIKSNLPTEIKNLQSLFNAAKDAYNECNSWSTQFLSDFINLHDLLFVVGNENKLIYFSKDSLNGNIQSDTTPAVADDTQSDEEKQLGSVSNSNYVISFTYDKSFNVKIYLKQKQNTHNMSL